MPDPAESLFMMRQPTAERPLIGHTILLVEDSRFASEALRLMCLHSGARIRRADTLASARRHLRTYRPSILIIDLGLPDGDGAELISELVETPNGIDVVLAISGDGDAAGRASAAGAHGFLAKPLTSLAKFQAAIMEALPDGAGFTGPRPVGEMEVTPDPLALSDDLDFAASALRRARDTESLDYATAFLAGVARIADDSELENAVTVLRAQLASTNADDSAVHALADLVAQKSGRRSIV